jgi:hypothetical protein
MLNKLVLVMETKYDFCEIVTERLHATSLELDTRATEGTSRRAGRSRERNVSGFKKQRIKMS